MEDLIALGYERPPNEIEALYIYNTEFEGAFTWLLGVNVDTWYGGSSGTDLTCSSQMQICTTQAERMDLLSTALQTIYSTTKHLINIRNIVIGKKRYPQRVMQEGGVTVQDRNGKNVVTRTLAMIPTIKDTLTSMYIEFDLLATIRGFNGRLYDKWLPLGGDIYIGLAHASQPPKPASFNLSLSYSSLFINDNSWDLHKFRQIWNVYQHSKIIDHSITYPDELLNICTLANPYISPDTTNREVALPNQQRLGQFVQLWNATSLSTLTIEATMGNE